MRAAHKERRRARGLRRPDEGGGRPLLGTDEDVHPADVGPGRVPAGEAVLLHERALRLVEGDDAAVRRVPGVDEAGSLVARGRDRAVAGRVAEQGVAGRLDRPALALATDKAEDRAGVDDEDVAVDVEVRDLRDVAGDGQALLRGRREAAP